MKQLAALTLCASLATAQITQATDCTRDAMIVFDASGSMASMGFNGLDQPRILEARKALARSLPRVAEIRRIGLVIYGPGESPCRNVSVRLPPTMGAAAEILAQVQAVEPSGETPLTDAVRMAADVLIHANGRGIVVLVTDGRETCGGSPCTLAAEIAATSPDITVHVIGYRLRDTFFQWPGQFAENPVLVEPGRCLADLTGGVFVSTETVDDLSAALLETLGCAAISGAPPARWQG